MKHLTKKKRKSLQTTGKHNQCQCSTKCKNKAIRGSPFCSAHQTKCFRMAPLSGYEPDYDPSFWNSQYPIKETHNCFAYAFNINDEEQMRKCKSKECNIPFHQPGIAAGYSKFKSSKPKTCPNMIARLLGDNPQVQMTTFETKCPDGYSKIALIVDENEDYHFLRQDSNGYWSHKPGARKVTNLDASEAKIYDPALADYNYKKTKDGYLNYDMFCSYLCVPRTTPIKLKVGGNKLWNFIDKVVYINLDTRIDRRKHMEKMTSTFGDKALRYPAIEDFPNDIGCTKSHIAVLNMAIKENWDNVLILEDDAQWNKFDQGYKKLEELASNPYDVIMLGATHMKYDKETSKLIHGSTTTAYLVNNHYFKTLLNNFKEGLSLFKKDIDNKMKYSIDRWWNKLQKKDNWYIISPCLVYQMPSYSDIYKKNLDCRSLYEIN